MVYEIKKLKLTSGWLNSQHKEQIIECLINGFDMTSETEFTKDNILAVITAYIERNPFSIGEISEFIKYLNIIDINELRDFALRGRLTTERMISEIYRDLDINVTIHLL